MKWLAGIAGFMLMIWGFFQILASAAKYVVSLEGSLKSNWLREAAAFVVGIGILISLIIGTGGGIVGTILIAPLLSLGMVVTSGGVLGFVMAGAIDAGGGNRPPGGFLRALAIVGLGIGLVLSAGALGKIVSLTDASGVREAKARDEKFAAERACEVALGESLGSYRSTEATGSNGSFTVKAEREIGGVGGRCPILIVGRCRVMNEATTVTKPWAQDGYAC